MPTFKESDLRYYFDRAAGVKKDGEYIVFRCRYCSYQTFVEAQMFAHLVEKHENQLRNSAHWLADQKRR